MTTPNRTLRMNDAAYEATKTYAREVLNMSWSDYVKTLLAADAATGALAFSRGLTDADTRAVAALLGPAVTAALSETDPDTQNAPD